MINALVIAAYNGVLIKLNVSLIARAFELTC